MTRDGDAADGSNTDPTMQDSQPTVPEPGSSRRRDDKTSPRYKIETVLGRGGMGEVVSARDEQIGRSVAIKRLRSDAPHERAIARFLREAKIQGRLEHPAIVPVYELSRDENGEPFFVMKQLAGVTLREVLKLLAASDPAASATFPRQRLLRAFAEICLAIEFAHTRGVIHRDLKPENIMLGDFGEVYVLDWGIARVTSAPDLPSEDSVVFDAAPVTVAGAVLGTPGYMAPEHARGDGDLDGRADVYALGCMLFEILSLRRYHGHTDADTARVIEVSPELHAICIRATLAERGQRHATARELGAEVQRYLDGDRDLALRRQLAETELTTARAAFARGDDQPARREAIVAAGRALALDPTAREAADLVARMMLQPPAETPPEVDAEIGQHDLELLKKSARYGTLTALGYVAFIPILYWMGVAPPLLIVLGLLAAGIVVVEATIAPRDPYLSGYIVIPGHAVLLGLVCYMVTPVLIGSVPAAVIVLVMAAHSQAWKTWVVAVMVGVATLFPFVLHLLGVLTMFETEGGSIVLHTTATELSSLAVHVAFPAYMLLTIGVAMLIGRAQDDDRTAARRTLQIQAWHLRQLIVR